MEQSIGYSAEEPQTEDSPRYQRHDEYMLAKRQSSQEFLQYKSYHLHLKRKREGPPEFKNFPTSYWERLSYYRTYTNTPNKVQVMAFYADDFNKQIWMILLYVLLLSIPYTYVHVFLASYVPETPLYLAKMVPFMEGISISIMVAAIFELFVYVQNGVYILDFLFNAIFAKNPWNQCPEEGYFKLENEEVYCYHLDNIGQRIKNKTVIFDKTYYVIVEDNIKFQFGQILYHGTRKYIISNWLLLFYGVLIWTIVVICYKKIYSRWTWKVLHLSHSSTVAYYVVCYIYHSMYNVGENIPEIDLTLDPTTEYFPKMKFNMFAVSLMAPPVVHILQSRSSDEIKPSRDSAVIVLSNILYSLLRVLTNRLTKHYMETAAQLPIYMPPKSPWGNEALRVFKKLSECLVEATRDPRADEYLAQRISIAIQRGNAASVLDTLPTGHMSTWYIYFPLYFSLFYFGDVFSLLFFLQLFITETTACIIHLELTLDIIMSKWKMLPRRIIGFVLITAAVVCNTMQRYVNWNTIMVMFYNKVSVMVLEIIIIFWMYPVFRLTDDMSFHHGYPVHTGRLFCLMTAPLVVVYAAYKSLHTTFVRILPTFWGTRVSASMIVAFTLAGVPVVAGMCYAYYKYVLKARRSWRRLFAPAEDWGPKDYVVRQLRKDYDSRTFTNSEVSRNLSRHIFTKTERRAYDLDISYDPNRRSTQIAYELKGTGTVQ